MDENTQPKYVRELFEDDFFDKFAKYLFALNSDNYINRMDENIKTSIHLEEKRKPNEKIFDEIHGINTLSKVDKLSFSQYKSFLINFPILLDIATQHCYLHILIYNIVFNQEQEYYFNFNLNAVNFFTDYIKRSFIKIQDYPIQHFDGVCNQIPLFHDFVDIRNKSPFIQFGIIFEILKNAIKLSKQIQTNVLGNIDTLLKTYADYDSLYLNDSIADESKDSIRKKREDFIHKNIILNNINLKHGGNKELTKEEKELIFAQKKLYDNGLYFFKKLKFFTKLKKKNNLCKYQAIYELGNLSLDEKAYSNYKKTINELFHCPANNDDKKCKYKKSSKCNNPKYKDIKWNMLEFVQKNYPYLHSYLIFEQNIKTDVELITILERQKASELALMFAKEEFAHDSNIICIKENECSVSFKNKSNKTILNYFSDIEEPKKELPQKVLLLKKLSSLFAENICTGSQSSKQDIYNIIDDLKK